MKVKGIHTTNTTEASVTPTASPKEQTKFEADATAIAVYKNENGDFFTLEVPFNTKTLQLGTPIAEDANTRYREEAMVKFKMKAVETGNVG